MDALSIVENCLLVESDVTFATKPLTGQTISAPSRICEKYTRTL